ncbi:MAG: transposase [Chloroflexota bacterium]|nr:transposase [Chloroflexota bacterium]
MTARKTDKFTATYQTRIRGNEDALAAYAELYGTLQRSLSADISAGHPASSLKSDYISRYGIPARMFNSLRVTLEGRMSAARESQKLHRETLQRLIARASRRITNLGRRGKSHQVHHKRRRLENLRYRLEKVESDIDADILRLCFGSKRLWRAQHSLKSNGYADHAEWLSDWRDARGSEFFVLGSRDENAGCQLCVAAVADDGSLTLRLRLPDCLAEQNGKYVTVENVRFAYGHEHIVAALQSNADYKAHRRQHGERAVRATQLGQAISYRFKRDGRGWRVFATTGITKAPVVTDRRLGAVGVDLNADHPAVTETDRSGNFVNTFSVTLVTYGKSAHQAEALIGDAVARAVEYARESRKPLVIERLDFRHKRAALEGESPRRSRMLSSFSYGKVKTYLLSRGYREGVEVFEVNPAYSSVIGRVKYMERYGLSVHQAAALVLARRLLGCREGIPRLRIVPLGRGGHVAFRVPVRKRVKHVWSYWAAVSRQLGPALAAQHRLARANPVRAPA